MFDILTPGQKLKKLRKELHLTQAQLASGTISREFISMVEHDVRRLSFDNSCLLMNRIKQISTLQTKSCNYPDDYLSITPIQEFNRFVEHLNFNDSSIEQLDELYRQSIELDQIESQAILLKGLAKKNIYNDYDQAFLYFTKAKELFALLKNYEEISKINNNLGALCQIHNKLNDAVIYLEMALSMRDSQLQDNEKYSITLNLALAYSKLQLDTKCLLLLNKELEEDYLNDLTEEKVNILLLRAIALSQVGNVQAGLALIEHLEEDSVNFEKTQPYILSNKIYMLKKIDLAMAIKEQLKLMKTQTDDDITLQNLSFLGDLYYEKEDFEKSLFYHQSASNLFNSETYPELQLDIFEKIIRDHRSMGTLDKGILMDVIDFCKEHDFKETLTKYGVIYLSMSKTLSDDDSKIVKILNTFLEA